MAYSWQTINGMEYTFPIPAGTEIRSGHFETLRRFIYMRRFIGAGRNPISYADPIRNSTWAAWCDDNISLTPWPGNGLGYQHGQWQKLINIVFRSSANEPADLYTVYTHYAFGSMDDLKANPPVFSDGTLNSGKWCYAVDVNRYHDFDRWSGRKIVKTYTKGSLDTYLSACEGWRYLPIQVGRDYQRKNIKYTDTGRIINSKPPVGRELNWHDLSQPSTMGPNYDILCEYDPYYGSYLIQTEPLSGADDCDSMGAEGWQDALPFPDADPPMNGDGAPSDAMPHEWVDEYQHAADPKFCDAYQNQVEQLIGAGNFLTTVNVGTPWGALFKTNHDNIYWGWVTSAGNYDGYQTFKKYEDGIWYKWGDGRGQTPSEANGWERLDWGYGQKSTEPKYVSMCDERFGCNGSAVELALWMTGQYDWYYCTQHIFSPRELLKRRAHEFYHAPNPLPDPPGPIGVEAWVNRLYPQSAGTWRRTHKYTFGRPKGSEMMMPGSMTPTTYDYKDYQDLDNAAQLWFSGSFVPSAHAPQAEGDYLSPEQIAGLKARHNSVFNDYTLRYEQMRQTLNNLWSLLGTVDLIFKDVSVSFESRSGHGAGVDDQYASANAAYQAAKSAAEIDIASQAFAAYTGAMIGGWFVMQGHEESGPVWKWASDGSCWESNIVVDASSIPANVESLEVFCHIQPYAERDWPLAIVHPLTVQLDDVGAIPNFDATDISNWDYPDDYPEGWFDWGGHLKTRSMALDGAIMAITLQLGSESEDGKYHIPIAYTNALPESIGEIGVPHTVRVTSRADIVLCNYQIGIGIRRDLDDGGVNWSTKKYVTFTAIAVDDHLFNTNGDPD